MPSSSQRLRTICLAIMLVGLLAALYTLHQRVHVERSSRAVETVVDYNEMVSLAGMTGKPIGDVLTAMRKSGATAGALPEETRTTLENQGQITRVPSPALSGTSLDAIRFNADPAFNITGSPGILKFVMSGLSRAYPPGNLQDNASLVITINGPHDAVSELGLGLMPDKVKTILAAGLHLIPRLRSNAGLTKESLGASLDAVAKMLPARKDETEPLGIVIFDGATLPGYRELIPDLGDKMTADRLIYGAVEFSKQKGDEELQRKLAGEFVRVHSISLDELGNLKSNQAVQRFALAVKDRNIRVLYVHLPQVASVDPLAAAGGYLGEIRHELTSEGFMVSDTTPAHPFAPLHVHRTELICIFAGAGVSLIYWLLMILPVALPERTQKGLTVLLGLALVGAVGFGGVTALGSIGRILFGLLAAIGFAMLALTWSYRRLGAVGDTRPKNPWGAAILALLIATGITLVGGLFVAAMLADTRALVKVYQFVGIKAALSIPLLLLCLLMVTDGVARAGEGMSDYLARCRNALRTFSLNPLSIGTVVLALVGLAALALLLLRSGNEGMTVSNTELTMRSILERIMIARPRTKEFAIGHPCFLLAMFAGARGWRVPALLLLLAGAVGQVDVLNTYCHGHTPVLLSLLRTVNGLWLGVLVTVVLVWAVNRLWPQPAATQAPVGEIVE